MSVYLTIPSARPPAEANPVLERWRQMGYKIALWRDCVGPANVQAEQGELIADYVAWGEVYPGYAQAVNALVATIGARYADAEWFVAAGDDTLPDPTHTADEIAVQCENHFDNLMRERAARWECPFIGGRAETFGVMQPTGDDWGKQPHHPDPAMRGSYISRVAGSAWYGREYCRRINQGRGPLWPEYTHCFVDEEARAVALKYGVYWERPDLIHHHENWARKRAQVADMPEFLKEANSPEHWARYKAIYEARKAEGFPGSEPL